MIWPILFFLGGLESLSSVDFRPFQTNLNASKVVVWTSETDHDFGDLQKDKPVEYIFKFKNISTDTIMLQTVRTTCGCTAAIWTETPIAPLGEGTVTIEYDAYQGGDFSKKIRVFFDRQRKPEILRIRGTVH